MTQERKLVLPEGYREEADKLAEFGSVACALKDIRDDEELTIADQIALTEVESAPFHEEKRAVFFADMIRSLGVEDVRIDKEGNVIAVRPGVGGGPRLALAAHLDTVFPLGTNVKVRKEGTRYYAPGISDDARGLAVLLEVIRVLEKNDIQTEGDIVFVGTVGEEGNGDLRGSKYLFSSGEEKIDGFISIDGVNVSRVLHGSTGSRRFRVSYVGPGGHSWKNFGKPSATHALGRAIAKMADLQVPEDPRTTFTVGVVKGGTSVNAIAGEAEMEVDLRSIGNKELNDLVEKVLVFFQEAADEENKRWNASGEDCVVAKIDPIGHRPAGDQKDDSPVLLSTKASQEILGIPLTSYTYASTDQNVAISRGIPATTLGGGGSEGFNHNLKEWYDSTESYLGPQLALLTVLQLVGIQGAFPAKLQKMP